MATQRVLPERSAEQRIPMSYEEFLAQIDEDAHAEWVAGEVIVFMPPSPRHQIVSDFLTILFATYANLFGLGQVISAPVEMRALPGGSAREPDILFVAQAHLDRITAQRVDGPADLIVEVLSPESVRRDQVEKRREYAAAGVPEYWVIDSRANPIPPVLYRLAAEGRYVQIEPDAAGRLHSVALPGFWLDPAWLQQEPLPDPLGLLMSIAPAALRARLDAAE